MTAESFVVQSLTRGAATWAIIFGFVTFLGGRDRWTQPAYASALEFPGAPESLGIILCIAGIVLLVGSIIRRRALSIVGASSATLWCVFFSWALIREAFRNPLIAPTSAVTYAGIATGFAILAWYHVRVRQ